jgi:hypothetical protein
MSSPLDFIANAWLTLSAPGVPSVVDGRITSTPGALYAVRLYLVRQDSTRTSTGWSSLGDQLPGASGNITLQRGWALSYAPWTLDTPWPTSLTPLLTTTQPDWLDDGAPATLHAGRKPSTTCTILSAYGRYSGAGIDDIVSAEVGGIPLILQVGEVVN